MRKVKLYKLSVVDRYRVQVRIPDWDRRTIKHLLEIEAAGRYFTVTYLGNSEGDTELFALPLKGAGVAKIKECLTSPGLNRVAGLIAAELTIPQRMLEVTAEAINDARLRLKSMQR